MFSPFEVACLDIQGQAAGRPVADLLGGAVRDEVPFSGYLFYKWAAHPGAEPDDWGEALDPDGIVAQARRMVGQYGFTALKLKGGVFP
ncbi:MAG TPA: glucarate dehydratase, partial [Streptosporangiaceae bacterium]|nr:glucarate dehydratase [Streptosporangiaceae bacterium]